MAELAMVGDKMLGDTTWQARGGVFDVLVLMVQVVVVLWCFIAMLCVVLPLDFGVHYCFLERMLRI
jgi:hypothetical protein